MVKCGQRVFNMPITPSSQALRPTPLRLLVLRWAPTASSGSLSRTQQRSPFLCSMAHGDRRRQRVAHGRAPLQAKQLGLTHCRPAAGLLSWRRWPGQPSLHPCERTATAMHLLHLRRRTQQRMSGICYKYTQTLRLVQSKTTRPT